MSRSSRPSSSANSKATVRMPSWVSLRSRSRASSNGPRSEMVARMGCPWVPKRSQNTVGAAANWKSVIPIF
jgi:hypothetical protein